MRATTDFAPIAPDEKFDLAIDFAAYLATGDSIASVASWTCTVAVGSLAQDPTPSARLIGPPSFLGTVVVQTVDTCVAGVTYVMEALVITTDGEELSIWSYQPCVAVGQ